MRTSLSILRLAHAAVPVLRDVARGRRRKHQACPRGRWRRASTPTPARASSASEVGAEIETSVPAPNAAVLATISNEAAAGDDHKAVAGSDPPRSSAPISLSSALWRPTSSRATRMAPSRCAPGGGVDRARRGVERLAGAEAAERGADSPARRPPSAPAARGFGRCREILDAAQRRSRCAPSMRPRAREMRAHALAASARRTRTPLGTRRPRCARISSTRATIPSVNAKPTAKSSRSPGVAIITAKGAPPNEISTGVSTATRAPRRADAPAS